MRSALGSFRSRLSTAAAIDRRLANKFSALGRVERHQLAGALKSVIVPVRGTLKSGDLFWRGAVFALGIVSGFHSDRAKGDDIGTSDNADVLAPSGRVEPAAQIFLC